MAKVHKEFDNYLQAKTYFESLDRKYYIAEIYPNGGKWIVTYLEKNEKSS